jgi:regulator of nucleoside diphosphate kinase
MLICPERACSSLQAGFLTFDPRRFVFTMSTQPSIIVTRLDLQRLEAMLDSLDEYGPAAEALEQELARAQVVGHDEVPAGVVTMNSRVNCRDESTGKEYHLTLVYPRDAGKDGTVSILAPVGTALLGLTVGQHIDWPAPSGKLIKLMLLSIDYQPEAAGEYQQ